MKPQYLALPFLAFATGTVHAQVTLVEPGHTLTKVADSINPLHPSQTLMETLTPAGEIESICLDPATGDIYVQLIEPGAASISLTTHIYKISPAGVTTPLSLFTGFGVNERGVDMHFDPNTGLLVTQDQNVQRVATVNPLTGFPGTYSFVTSPVFDPSGSTFGMDFSQGAGASHVPPGNLVFTSDVGAAGIHDVGFIGTSQFTHIGPATAGPADDMVIQPDGDWILFGDSGGGIWNYAPSVPHTKTATPLDVQAMFVNAGLPFTCGTRATVCDTTGNSYASWSCLQGANGVFRINEALTTSTLLLTAGPGAGEGIHDITIGPSRLPGTGNSLYFTVHNFLTGGEEVWEMTTLACCDTPSSVTRNFGLGLNAPTSLNEFPTGNLPSVGNAGFAEIMDDPFNACGITPGSPVVLFACLLPTSIVLPSWGCVPGGFGEFVADVFTPGSLVGTVGPAIWFGPGSGAVLPLPIPQNLALCGLPVYTQGVWVDGPRFILSEGLDLVIGF